MEEQAFLAAQSATLAHFGVEFEQRFVKTPIVGGRAQVLVAGDGPPAILVNGIGTPAAMFAPLMCKLNGLTLHAVDLPGYGLTDTTPTIAQDLRATAIAFLGQVLDGLKLDRPTIIANSLGSSWASWFAIDQPDRVGALVHIGCPALLLNTSAPLPMRLLSKRGLGRMMMRLQPPSHRQVEQLSRMVNEYPLPSTIADLLLATERLPGFEPTFLSMLGALIGLHGARPGMALGRDQLARIDTPTLLIFARNDPFGGEEVGRNAVDAMPDALLRIVDGGHAPWLHHADQIAPMIRGFLGSGPAPAPAYSGRSE